MVAVARPLPAQPALPTWVRPWLRTKIYIGGAIVLGLILLGLFGPLLAPYDPNAQQLRESLQAPQGLGGAHWLGTDNLGRDIFSRLLYGARVSLIIAFTVVIISGAVGVTLGAISGYFGGRVDFFIQKLVEVIWAFPSLLLAIAIMAYLGQGLQNLILALVAQRWISYCRVVRGEALGLRHREFVTAAQVVGAGHARIIAHHIIPNIIPSSLVIGTFAMATAIIAEASLSFLGLGVPPDVPTWGTMLGDGRNYISTAPWLTIFPGLAIFTVVLGINLLGDGLRDVLDPRRKKAAADL
ncbi:MAG TPA: ABC transporter permease [Chloroflexota bacterium]|nr:ABC transporter permease [Chloroflexota bacterium]